MDKRLEDAGFLASWIVALEQKFPVELWSINGIRVWPLIRTRLYLEIFSKFNVAENPKRGSTSRPGKLALGLRLIKEFLRLLAFIIRPLKRTKVIYAGFSGHRVVWQGNSYNRYFDPIMDRLETTGENANSKLVEYEHESDDSFI